jgi:hypothetical protein
MRRQKTFLAGAFFLFPLAIAAGGCSGPASEAKGTVDVVVSGEELATTGILFPMGSEVRIADGWEVRFDHVLITVGTITLSENPDKAPSDQSQTGAVVIARTGPWAVDLHKQGTIPGAGGEGTATPVVTLEPLDTDQRYAFSYDVVAASDQAVKVNFEGDPESETAYAEMVTKGYTVMYVGTATFKGTTCDTSNLAYDFTRIPEAVKFRLGFESPTSYINCQNQQNQGEPFPDEQYQRGVAIPANAPARAQMTFHIEHPFYSDVKHEPALHFDQMASRLAGKPADTTLTMEDLTGVDPTAFTDGQGADLPWRVCDGSALAATAQMSFGLGSVPVNPGGQPQDALRDYRDYVLYVQSTQGHLNGGEGICYTKRNYPSPP